MLLTLADYEQAAQARLRRPVWDFIAGGTGEDGTVEANRQAFAGWRFRPRVLADVSAIDTSTTLLGYSWQAPIAIAPTALHQLCTAAGELASAAAAAATGLPFAVSMYASRTIEELAHASPLAMLWQQLYLLKDRAVTASVAERAEAAGAGIRSGRDVLTALALGAAAVLVGRPVLHGLAVADTAGATAVLTTLIDELVDAMGHCGRPNLDSIDPGLVTPAQAALTPPHSTTATDADIETGTTTCRDSTSPPPDRRLHSTVSAYVRG